MSTRLSPRTRVLVARTPSRRAAPTRASPSSGPGQLTCSAAERPEPVSEPRAMNAPRQAAAAASQPPPVTTIGGSPRTGRPAWSIRPTERASAAPCSTRSRYRGPGRERPAGSTQTSAEPPNNSPISRRSRRATRALSSSAATCTRPAARYTPPAKRSTTDTSARRQHALPTGSRLSSSLIAAVTAGPAQRLCAHQPGR